ncbi:pyruvate formate lyase family protein, partial [uncultured Anaerococcus sp.]|uniref:pyruvate formate lyase family protein n=1 Tax=uncultured Anaerococcus sp. TaxID=293428 RepID=UPI00280B5EEE
MEVKAYDGFKGELWKDEINVRNFIQENYTPYEGGDDFLAGKSEKTTKLFAIVEDLINKEIRESYRNADTSRFSSIDGFDAGYIDKENEVIVGLQTDEVLKRIVNPYGGYRMVEQSLEAYGQEMDPVQAKYFKEFRKTHNEGVFDAYTTDMRKARTVGLLTGLPDAYGRGRIIGDYRRIALYGIDRLVEEKKKDLDKIEIDENNLEATIRLREEVSEQIRALGKIKNMAAKYGIDISKPATNAREAAQFLYLGYLAAVKENNGAAMSIGRNAGFLDIYIKRDMDRGIIDEVGAQEIIDQLVIKLRLVRHLRTPDYDEVFGGDPTWVTESIGGMGLDGRTLVTKTAFRYLNTLINLGSAPEPNMTILWAEKLPEGWKKFCSKVSILTDSIQYENDDLMRNMYGDDYAIACCVSAMEVGKEMQFFGARANLAKSLLYSINGGVDEKKKNKDGSLIKVFDDIEPITTEYLDYDQVLANYKKVLSELAGLYVKTLDVIHFMHDKYAYEAGQMALHDTYVKKNLATGVAGLSIAADSLSAIKYAKVKPVRDENGIAIDFETEGDFPKYGNDDDRVDQIAVDILTYFSNELKKHATYKNAKLTLSALTITSN